MDLAVDFLWKSDFCIQLEIKKSQEIMKEKEMYFYLQLDTKIGVRLMYCIDLILLLL